MKTDRSVYAVMALNQVPRLLTFLDRNPFSPTYGCFHRDYWLYKTSDFPDAVRQFAVHALALVYTCDFPDNPYRDKARVLEWILAGLDYWTRIQHGDGSYDEFYPNERGWVGPSAFTCYTVTVSAQLLQDRLPDPLRERLRQAVRTTARFIARGEAEEDHLANHHAMACLAVWKAASWLGDHDLRKAWDALWQRFLTYHRNEGWSVEYDGIDPGYLSATVSFLAKIYQDEPMPEILRVAEKSIELCSYFAYPNGSYAGLMGSRNTQHFYCHGFEVFAPTVPLAAAVAEQMLQGLARGKLVPPAVMSDRYVGYRVPEFLLAYLDCAPRPEPLPQLPWQHASHRCSLTGARVWAAVHDNFYVLVNGAKGGAIKVFDRVAGELLVSDGGILAAMENGTILTSQWIDPEHDVTLNDDGCRIAGRLNVIPSYKLFTPFKNILFRAVMCTLGHHPTLAHWIKGRIRKILMLGTRRSGVWFERIVGLRPDGVHWSTRISFKEPVRFKRIQIGDEFFVRYVPQSRFFQFDELVASGYNLSEKELALLHRDKSFTLECNTGGQTL